MRKLALSLALSLLLLPALCWAGRGDYLRITNNGGKGGVVAFKARIGGKVLYGRTESPESVGDKTTGRFAIHLTRNPATLGQARRASDTQARKLLNALQGMPRTKETATLKGFIQVDVLGE